jgi:hypothetical protein
MPSAANSLTAPRLSHLCQHLARHRHYRPYSLAHLCQRYRVRTLLRTRQLLQVKRNHQTRRWLPRRLWRGPGRRDCGESPVCGREGEGTHQGFVIRSPHTSPRARGVKGTTYRWNRGGSHPLSALRFVATHIKYAPNPATDCRSFSPHWKSIFNIDFSATVPIVLCPVLKTCLEDRLEHGRREQSGNSVST